MKIILMHQTVTNHDAIGNDIEIMYSILREKYECYVYAQNCFNSRIEYISEELLKNAIKEPENLIIYHHSVFWEYGEEVLKEAKAKIVFRYHNITPEEFFEGYNDHHYSQCKYGRIQTVRMAKDYGEAFWLCDSNYNAKDVVAFVDSERIAVCPPFNKIEEWAEKKPDEQILKSLLLNRTINLLFVGRVAPNKGHLQLLEIVNYFCRNYDDPVKLRIIGKFDEGLPKYNTLVTNKIAEYGLGSCVEFIGEINDATLMAYYLGSDIFLCTSDHEGFCVPLIEANFFEVPVVAKDTSAICETMGNNQLVLEDNYREYAAAIHVIMKNRNARDMLVTAGKDNYSNRFSYGVIRKMFCEIINREFGLALPEEEEK